MIRIIILLFFSVQTQYIPIEYEVMEQMIGSKVVHVSNWHYSKSELYGDCLIVAGELFDESKFIISFDGEDKNGTWITNGKAEMCIGKNYCNFNEFGCDGRCKYVCK